MHLHRTEAAPLQELLTLDDADRLLTSSAIRTPAIRVARDGEVLAESSYTKHATQAGKPMTGLVDGRKALHLFDEGATIVFQGLQRYWEPLTRLVADLELELGHPCQANAYLTPPGSQGFAVHSDSHDVFVFQTHGAKQWEVHPDEGVMDVLMEPGLSMYLPTGTPHAARAQQATSLHVTVGINQLTWRDLVRRSIEKLLDDVDATHLPAGYLDEPALLTEGLKRRLADLTEALACLEPERVAVAARDRFLTTRPAPLRGGLLDRDAGALTDATRLRRRPGRPCVLESDGDHVHVLLGDRRLTVPGRLRNALEQVRDADVFTPGDLRLDQESRVVLCRRLVKEGLLEMVG
jgi:hypothetical protein